MGRRAGVVALVAWLVVAACAGSATRPASGGSAPSGSSVRGSVLLRTTGPGAATPSPPSASLAELPARFGDVDAHCRESMAGGADLRFVVGTASASGLTALVYAGPAGNGSARDWICLDRPDWSIPMQEGSERLSLRLSSEERIVLPDERSFVAPGENFVWGAVAPETARVAIEIAGRAQASGPIASRDAVLANGYFVALIGPDVPCCLFTVVAYDGAGLEVGRDTY